MNKYGLQSIATKEHAKILISVRAFANEHIRIGLFARMIGLQRALPKIVTNFILHVWGVLRPNFDATNKEREKYDQTAYIASTYCVEAVDTIFNVHFPSCSYYLQERQRNKLIKRLWDLSKNPNTRKSHGRQMLPVAEVVELFVSACETESIRLDQLYRALFEASDVNGDQELTLAEFRAMLRFVEHARTTLTAYNSPTSSPASSRPSSPKLTSNSLNQYEVGKSIDSTQANPNKSPINSVQLYQLACYRSHELSDAELPPDQITPQGFAVAMQSAFRGTLLLLLLLLMWVPGVCFLFLFLSTVVCSCFCALFFCLLICLFSTTLGRSVPVALSSVPVISEELLRKAVHERWAVARPAAVSRAESLEGNDSKEEDEKEFLVHLIHRIDELCNYPKEEHVQASWIAMDMLQNLTIYLHQETEETMR